MKWCTYCRKADHSDAECWCTRVAPYPSDPMFGLSVRQVAAPGTSSRLMAALREAAVLPPQDISAAPEFTL